MEGKHYDKIVEDDWIELSGCITTSNTANTANCVTLEPTTACTIDPKYWEWVQAPGHILSNNKKGDDDMRYLYKVILVNPKNDNFYVDHVIARSETSALMGIYHRSQFDGKTEFDDLRTSCRVLMEWKKEKSLKKAIETIKKAVE